MKTMTMTQIPKHTNTLIAPIELGQQEALPTPIDLGATGGYCGCLCAASAGT